MYFGCFFPDFKKLRDTVDAKFSEDNFHGNIFILRRHLDHPLTSSNPKISHFYVFRMYFPDFKKLGGTVDAKLLEDNSYKNKFRL